MIQDSCRLKDQIFKEAGKSICALGILKHWIKVPYYNRSMNCNACTARHKMLKTTLLTSAYEGSNITHELELKNTDARQIKRAGTPQSKTHLFYLNSSIPNSRALTGALMTIFPRPREILQNKNQQCVHFEARRG